MRQYNIEIDHTERLCLFILENKMKFNANLCLKGAMKEFGQELPHTAFRPVAGVQIVARDIDGYNNSVTDIKVEG